MRWFSKEKPSPVPSYRPNDGDHVTMDFYGTPVVGTVVWQGVFAGFLFRRDDNGIHYSVDSWSMLTPIRAKDKPDTGEGEPPC